VLVTVAAGTEDDQIVERVATEPATKSQKTNSLVALRTRSCRDELYRQSVVVLDLKATDSRNNRIPAASRSLAALLFFPVCIISRTE
jgi:hypothetical protein